MLGHSALGRNSLGTLDAPATATLGATEGRDGFAGSLNAVTTFDLVATEAPDTVSIAVDADPNFDTHDGDHWTNHQPYRRVRERVFRKDRDELRTLIRKASRGESLEAEAVIEAARELVEQGDDGLNIDWAALEHAQGQLSDLMQAMAAFEDHQRYVAAQAEFARVMKAERDRDDDDATALLLAV